MRIADLVKIEKGAPESGYVLAYTRTEVIFHEYVCLKDIFSEFAESEFLELHLFDTNKEYRAVKSESHRFKNGVIECIADFTDNQYGFQAKLEDSEKQISTICHIEYDPDNGMAFIDNYRLSI